ncbi:MAG: secretin N-terminal domain-containing protein [Telluria sp.]
MATQSRHLHSLAVFVLVGVLAGCAAQRLQREGMDLIAAGQVEEGLDRLAASSKADPSNVTYRATLSRQRELAVNKLVSQGDAARAAGDAGAARTAYERALHVNPADRNARAGLANVEMDARHASELAEAGQLEARDEGLARELVRRILLEDPAHRGARQLMQRLDERASRAEAAVPSLAGRFRSPVSLQFRDANVKVVLESLARAAGINILLDKDVKPDIKVSIFVKDVSVQDALELLLMQSQLEKKLLSDSTVLVYPNTPAKLKDYQDLKIRSFHLVNADAKQIAAMIKTLLKTRDIVVHERTNSVVMRDTPEAVELAARLVEDQDVADPEVMLEVEVLEVSGSRMSELGLALPSSIGVSVPGDAVTVGALRDMKAANLLVGPAPSVTLNLLMQDSDANLLASPRIRARNHEKARIMIGDRVPVITNAVTPVSTGTPVITGNVQYLDVGLKLEVEPDIHLDDDVSIKINLEVSSIVKEIQNVQSGTLAYQVGTRNATTVLRLRDGETQILGGLINDEDRNSASKVPGLGQLPLLGRLFSSHRDDARKTEIVLSITPHVIGVRRAADARHTEYWSGTESSLGANPLLLRPLGTVAISPGGAPLAAPRAAAAPMSPRAPLAASPATQPVVLSWQGPAQAKVGDHITVALNTQSSQPVQGIKFALSYDAALLKAVEAAEGDFMKQGQVASAFTRDIDGKTGQVRLELAATSGAASGAGTVASVEFEVLAAGTAQVAVAQAAAGGASGDTLAVTAPAPLVVQVQP